MLKTSQIGIVIMLFNGEILLKLQKGLSFKVILGMIPFLFFLFLFLS